MKESRDMTIDEHMRRDSKPPEAYKDAVERVVSETRARNGSGPVVRKRLPGGEEVYALKWKGGIFWCVNDKYENNIAKGTI